MIKIVVGSRNPVKINAIKQAFSQLFTDEQIECVGVDAPSGVADQPMTQTETRQGALNRVDYCKAQNQADYYAAIEGGVHNFTDGPATFAYIAIANEHKVSVGRSTQLPLPQRVYQALVNGQELGKVMDDLFNTQNVKQKQGAIGLLTQGQASRESVYTQAAILTLAPFIHTQLYT
ncbi:inosine/xanthosine triphosphatase [Paraglaciecola aestuariivivens]